MQITTVHVPECNGGRRCTSGRKVGVLVEATRSVVEQDFVRSVEVANEKIKIKVAIYVGECDRVRLRVSRRERVAFTESARAVIDEELVGFVGCRATGAARVPVGATPAVANDQVEISVCTNTGPEQWASDQAQMWLIWSSSAHLAHTGIHVPKRQRGCRAVAARKAGVDAESAGAVIYEELVGSAAVLTVRRAGE